MVSIGDTEVWKVLRSASLGPTERFHPVSPKSLKFKPFVLFGLTECFHPVPPSSA